MPSSLFRIKVYKEHIRDPTWGWGECSGYRQDFLGFFDRGYALKNADFRGWINLQNLWISWCVAHDLSKQCSDCMIQADQKSCKNIKQFITTQSSGRATKHEDCEQKATIAAQREKKNEEELTALSAATDSEQWLGLGGRHCSRLEACRLWSRTDRMAASIAQSLNCFCVYSSADSSSKTMPAEIWTLGNDRRESERSRIKKSHRSLHRSPPSGNQQASRGWGGTSSSEGRCFETWLSWSCFNSFLLCLWIWTQNSAEHFKNSIFSWLHINQRNCVCLSYCLRCCEELKKLLRLLRLRCFSSQSWRTSDRPELSQLRVLHVQIVLSCCFFCGLCNLV